MYVVDTGININHVEFEGRAYWGKTIPLNDIDEDGNGHGTHCAGTIASRKYGVAKAANVIAVKVLGSNGSGTMSDVVGGVLWAAEQAAKKLADAKAEYAATGKTKHKGSVANMSLGGGKSQALDDAVNRAVDSGMHFAVAAGNDNRDACSYSPAAAAKAVTVGASTLGDERAYFSNYGECVDVFAPGQCSCSSSQKSTSHVLHSRFEYPLHLDRKRDRHQHHFWYFHGFSPHRRSPRLPPLSLSFQVLRPRCFCLRFPSRRSICSSARSCHRLLLCPCCPPLLDVFDASPSRLRDRCSHPPSHLDTRSAQESSHCVVHPGHPLRVAA